MNKFFTKLATAFVGMAMAIGVGVGVGNRSDVKVAKAANNVGASIPGYVQATSVLDITSNLNKKFLIAVSTSNGTSILLPSNETSNGTKSGTTYNNTVLTNYLFDIAAKTINQTDGYTIKGTSRYYGWTSSTTIGTAVSSEGDLTTSYLWTISKQNNGGTIRLTNVGAGTRGLVYRKGTTNKFGAYATSNVNNSEYYDLEVYYQASNDPIVTIDDTATALSLSVKESSSSIKTLSLTNVTMAELTIASANTGIATVSQDNENKKITITGVVYGETSVTIKKGNDLLYTVNVSVGHNNDVTITAAGDATSLKKGQTLQLSASSSKDSITGLEDTFTWTSSNDSVAEVDSTGLVSGVTEGSVTITASSGNYDGTSGTYNLNITFGSDQSVAVFYNSAELGNTNGTSASGSYVKGLFSGNATVIYSVETYKANYDKFGGLSLGTGSYDGNVTIKMNDSYKLKSVSIWGAVVDTVTAPTVTYGTGDTADTSATKLANGASMLGKSEAFDDENTVPFTYTFASGAKTIKIAATSKSLKWTIYKVVLCWTEVKASSISFLSGSNITLMNGLTKQLSIKPTPLFYNSAFTSLTWNSATPSVATVTSSGLVEAVADAGTSVITATANTGTALSPVNIIATTTVKAIANVASSITITSSDVGNSFECGGVTWAASKASRYGNDATSGGDLVSYSRGGIKLDTGYIQNSSASVYKIEKVHIALCLAANKSSFVDAALTVVGSNTSAGGSDVASTNETVGGLKTYTLGEGCDYVKISCAVNLYFNSITIEFATPEETIYSVADFILGLQPDRGEESINICNASNGVVYLAAKKRLGMLSGSDRATFQSSEDSTVVSARTRYEFWAGNNHDAAPYDGSDEIQSSRTIQYGFNTQDSTTTLVIIVISLVSITAIGGFFFLRKRKEER